MSGMCLFRHRHGKLLCIFVYVHMYTYLVVVLFFLNIFKPKKDYNNVAVFRKLDVHETRTHLTSFIYVICGFEIYICELCKHDITYAEISHRINVHLFVQKRFKLLVSHLR